MKTNFYENKFLDQCYYESCIPQIQLIFPIKSSFSISPSIITVIPIPQLNVLYNSYYLNFLYP